jgi:hypothetical protein
LRGVREQFHAILQLLSKCRAVLDAAREVFDIGYQVAGIDNGQPLRIDGFGRGDSYAQQNEEREA